MARPRNARALLLFTASLLVAWAGSPALALEIKDGDFGGGWQYVPVQTGTGGSFDVSAGGGNPGVALITHTHINGDCGAIFGFGFKTDKVWTPNKDGAITRLDYSEDARLVDGFGGGQAIGPAIRQGGNYYRLPAGATGTNENWFTLSLTNIQASQFIRVIPGGGCGSEQDPSSHPDFSASGGPIEFGFVRANSQINGQGPYDITAALDNFHVFVNGVNYISLGDSYSSGEGVPPFHSGSDTPYVNVCHRSLQGYGWLIQFPGVDLTPARHLACSGADIVHVLPGGRHPPSAPAEPAQLDRPGVNTSTEMVTITIGGNDLGFAPILQQCAKSLDCSADSFRPWGPNGPSLRQGVEARIPAVKILARATYSAILGETNGAPTFVLGYPRLFGIGACTRAEILLAYSKSEQKWIDQLADKLNLALNTAAFEAGVHYADVRYAFKGHGVCSNFSSWIHSISIPPVPQVYGFHPTSRGQWAYAGVLDAHMRDEANLPNWPKSPAGIPLNPGSVLVSSPAPNPPPAQPSGTGPTIGGMLVRPHSIAFCDSGQNYVAGQDIDVLGSGFEAGAAISLRLTSGAFQADFATATADGTGALDAVATLPSGIPTNADALLEVRGTGENGAPRLLATGIRLSTSFFTDADFDEIADPCDLCPDDFDSKNLDADGDFLGDVCDACPSDPENDLDFDTLCATADPCPWDPQNDADGDTLCESEDNCPLITNASQSDADNDGVGDPCDGAPNDSDVFAVPGEVDELFFDADKTTLTWESSVPSSGYQTVHDVARGALDALPVGAGTCVASGVAETSAGDTSIPAPGAGYWYLARGRNSLGSGTYGQRSDGAPRITAACP